MKIALVHDYIKEMGGAERVLLELSRMYPTAPIYTAFVDRHSVASRMWQEKRIIESKWGWLLKIGKLYSYLRFCLPWVWKSLDLSDYDLIITSCSGYIARGFEVRKDAKIIAYCHTPPRWLYGYDTPTGAQNKWWGKIYLWVFGPFVRYFDYVSAQRVDKWIANSREVKSRIAKFYRKEAVVVYPPCVVSEIQNASRSDSRKTRTSDSQKYWLIVSRIVGGKGIEEAIELVKKTGEKLVIVGIGPIKDKLQCHSATHSTSSGQAVPQVEWRGYVPDNEMGEIYDGAKGFLALAKDEDFGMTVVEAMAHGVPVLAYNGGGYKETVIDGMNGKLAKENEIARVMKDWDNNKWDKKKIRESVKKFGKERFEKEIRKIIKEL